MSERFFSAAPITTDRATLDGPEAHHLLHVMRAAIGDHVILFDNSGAEFPATIEKLGRATVDLRVIERLEIDRELPFPLTVGVALPKGDRQKWLVEKLTELGVATLVPLITARSVTQPAAATLQRLERVVVEASKQCGRNRLMRIAHPQTWEEWIGDQSAIRNPQSEIVPRRLIAHPGGISISELRLGSAPATHLTVGPEGGLSDAEVAAARSAGWQNINLGPRILRVETAVVALTAAVMLR
jgi:16S rRNA (uracil1498-N3)-methyltransferase